MIRSRSVSVAVLLLPVLGGCLGGTDLGYTPCPAGTETLDIGASVGDTVAFTWTPATCGIALLFVEPTTPGVADVWQIRSEYGGLDPADLINLMLTPLVYGATPPGTITDTGPDPLVPGSEYRVAVYRLQPDGFVCAAEYDNLCFVGEYTFTR